MEEVFFLLEEVIRPIFGGGRFCWRRCIFWNLEEVFFVGGGDVCFWSRVALTGHRTTLYAASEANYLSTEVLKYYFGT